MTRFYMWSPPNVMKASPLAQCKKQKSEFITSSQASVGNRRRESEERGGKMWQGTQGMRQLENGREWARGEEGGDSVVLRESWPWPSQAPPSGVWRQMQVHLPSHLQSRKAGEDPS